MRKLFLFGLVGMLWSSCCWQSVAAGPAKYFVLIVWDGMRPDFVSAELTPTLHALREQGVWFANHHSVHGYPCR